MIGSEIHLQANQQVLLDHSGLVTHIHSLGVYHFNTQLSIPEGQQCLVCLIKWNYKSVPFFKQIRGRFSVT